MMGCRIPCRILGIMLACSLVHGSTARATDVSAEISRPIRAERNLVFLSDGPQSVSADLYRPDDEAVYPLVIMIHGGGWSAGDKWNLQDHARELAQAGFVALSINYRMAPKHKMPDQISDCRAALRWAAGQATEWNADADRLCLWGYSAGGHLAAWMATAVQTGEPNITAVVAGGAPCDFEFIPVDSIALVHVMGGTRADEPDAYANASPLQHANPDAPPFFFFHGEADLIVPASSSRKLHERLLELRVPSEYYLVKGRGHLLTFIDREARRRAIDFLRQQTSGIE